MKKIFCIFALGLFALGTSLFAAGKGGFIDPAKGGKGGFQQSDDAGHLRTFSINEVRTMPDDTIVSVVGYIQERLGDDKYLFKEAASSNTIIVEIDDDKWGGQTVKPHDKVRLVGEVDKDGSKVKIDVKSVYKIREVTPDEVKGKANVSPATGCTNCGCAASTPAPK